MLNGEWTVGQQERGDPGMGPDGKGDCGEQWSDQDLFGRRRGQAQMREEEQGLRLSLAWASRWMTQWWRRWREEWAYAKCEKKHDRVNTTREFPKVPYGCFRKVNLLWYRKPTRISVFNYDKCLYWRNRWQTCIFKLEAAICKVFYYFGNISKDKISL